MRAGSSEVSLGHLRSPCLRGDLCDRSRTKRIISHIGRKSAFRWRCRVCASGREQSPPRASARVVLELDFVRAGSRKVPLGHLRSSCLRGVMCERARTKRIASHIGRNMRFVGEVELVCAGSSKPLLGAWMCASTCAASAAPVAQTAASYKNEQKSP